MFVYNACIFGLSGEWRGYKKNRRPEKWKEVSSV